MAAHRYWRVYVTKNVSNATTNFVGFTEIQMRTSVGGPDVCAGGIAFESGHDTSFVAANAFDNSGSTQWLANNVAFPHWVGYDFGAGNDKDIVEFAANGVGVTQWNALDFQLQYSDDFVGWTTKFTVNGETNWPGGTTVSAPTVWNKDKRCDVGAPAQMWRIYMTAEQVGGAANFIIDEIEMRSSNSGADQTGGGEEFASSLGTNTAFGAYLMFNNTSGAWQSYTVAEVPGWIVYKFPAPIEIVEITMTAAGSPNSTGMPAAFTVQRWDGAAWVDVYSVAGLTWASVEKKTFTWSGWGVERRRAVFVSM